MKLLLKIWIFVFCLVLLATGFSQSVTAPSATSYAQSTANQTASGFSVSGFPTGNALLITVGLVNPPTGTTLNFSTTSGVTASTGYNLSSNFTRISFTGTQANVNTVLASLRVNTGSVPGNVYIAVTATENPAGYFYLPTNGHFYRPISTTATYTNAKSASASTTFKGQTGYLVTITSSDEDAFIFNNVPQASIWFALSDAAQEGYWRIDAGPENGTLIKTQNGQFNGNITGQYNNWASGEPNNSGGEHYAVTKWGGGSTWNVLPNNFNCAYVIEYGTWTDPANQTFTNFFTGFVTHQIACSPATSPAAPTGTNGSRMNAGTVSLSATAPSGSTVDWYANSSGGNVLTGGLGVTNFTTPSLTSTTTYYAQARNTSTGCVSSSRTAVVATVNYPIPFTYSGFIYDSENTGMVNVSVDVYYKTKAGSTYSLLSIVTTDVTGKYTISTSLDVSLYDFRIEISNLSIPAPTTNDAQFFNQKVLNQSFSAKDYYRMDVNSNGLLTITDVFLVFYRVSGGINTWPYSSPKYRIFNSTQWSSINASSSNLVSSFPGSQTITVDNLTSGSTTNFYIIRTGYKQ